VLYHATNPPPGIAVDETTRYSERRSSSRLRIAESWRKIIQRPTESSPLQPLTRSNVAVWIASTASILQAKSALKLLTANDWEAFSPLSQASVRGSAVAARLLLRLGLSMAIDRRKAPQEWEFQRTPLGKPFVADLPSSINFTIAHTRSLTAVAVSTTVEIGIDIETIDQSVSDDLIFDNCSTTETRHLLSLPQAQRARQFIQLWTQKEAYSKLLGCGLSKDFSSLNLYPGATDPSAEEALGACYLEGFFIPADDSLHYGSLAVANDDAAGPIDVCLSEVSGPGRLGRSTMFPLV
jgi:phosphopantetheinyl transferase